MHSQNPGPKNAEQRRYRGSTRSIMMSLVGVSIVLALIPLINQPNTSNARSRSPSSNDDDDPSEKFYISHTLDPNSAEDTRYATWNSVDWVDWLNRREGMQRQMISRRRSRSRPRPINTKFINTVVIASRPEIREVFRGDLQTYGSYMFWSNRQLPTYLFLKSNRGDYHVYICPPTYIAVSLINGEPVHLQTFSTERVSRGNSNFKYRQRCTELN